MLPHSYHEPTGSTEFCVRVAVSRLVGPDFFAPPIRVVLRPASVCGATVPKAPVDEYGDTGSRKDHVNRPAAALEQGAVKSKSQAARVELRPKRSFPAVVATRSA